MINASKYLIADYSLLKRDDHVWASHVSKYQSPILRRNRCRRRWFCCPQQLLIQTLCWQVESHLRELCQKWNGRDKSETQQPRQHCSVNTWAVRHLRVLVTAVTHHCLMKLETQRNTNLDIAGYLYDIGHFKTNCGSLRMQAFTGVHTKQWLFVEALLASQLRQRSGSASKFLSSLQYYLIIQIGIYSLPLSSVTARQSWAYALIIASLPGQRKGQRTRGIIHCVSGADGPQQTRSTVDEGMGHTILLPKQPHLYSAAAFLCPLFPSSSLCSFLPSWMSKGVRKREYVFLFLLSVGSPQRHSDYYSLPPPPEGLFNRWLLSYPPLKKKSPYSLGLMETKKKKKTSSRRGQKKNK